MKINKKDIDFTKFIDYYLNAKLITMIFHKRRRTKILIGYKSIMRRYDL